MKRLFIAINLPDEVKDEIEQQIERLDSDFRWVAKDNWHITLVFLGYQPDEAIPSILESIKQTVQNFPAPAIEFDKIIFGPPHKPARMIWLTGTKETSKILGGIKNDLENNLVNNGVRFKMEDRPFNCHLTLARFQNIPEKLELSDSIHAPIKFMAQSIDLMESNLNPFGRLRVNTEQSRSIKRSGAEYEMLARIDFVK